MNVSSPIPILAVLDIDRTLFDTDAFMAAVLAIAMSLGADKSAFMTAKHAAEVSGSFDALGWLQAHLGGKYLELQVRYRAGEYNFVYEDAHAFLDYLTQRQIPILLMTHGGVHAQQFKILSSPRLATLDYVVIDAPNKGQRLQAAFRASQNCFVITADTANVFQASRLILADDKACNFAGLAADAPVLGLHVAQRSRSGNEAKLRLKPHTLKNNLWEAAAVVENWL